jgi:hypothetical protein
MSDTDTRIREEPLTTAVENWLEDRNPFSDIVFKRGLIDEVTGRLEDVDKTDVAYNWKLMTEEGYFRKRGKSRRITAKEIDEAVNFEVDVPLDEEVQTEILRMLAEAEREDVNYPMVSRDELIKNLDYDPELIDYNLFYCRSKGWVDVGVYISSNHWEDAEITKFGRDMVDV